MCKLLFALCLLLLILSIGLVAPLSANSEKARTLDVYMTEEGPTQRVYFYSSSGDERALVSLFHQL